MTFSNHITLPDIHRMPVGEAISCKRSRRALRRIRDALQKIPTRMSLKGAAGGFSTTGSRGWAASEMRSPDAGQ
jgi:hypothetical protein